ncbi:type IV toxin-antitoxin system AbiEi family antitoxin domain-containing protein [Microbacterium sp. NPDC028030]|uniref:type IV toxin-antitoxin system AbiEi family antitoxin domain-containing protein n=1 Tax=Microbacterium sp. NPDC028030 TaxID=3155124 RepID=UPI00340C32D9
MLDPTTTLHRMGGLARGRALGAFGISRKALSRAVGAGTIFRVRAGVFALPLTPPAVLSAAAHGGALTCTSALRIHGVWVLSEEDAVHVWLGRNGRAHPHENCRCVSHRFDGPTRLGVVDVEAALLHLYRCEGDESFFASFESAWRLGLVSTASRARIRSELPARARWLVDFARGNSDSGLESLLRLRLHLEGIDLTSQVPIPGVGRVDFVVDGRLIIEVDGRENHAASEKRHRDLVRDAVASGLGYETLRFDYAQVIHDWPAVSAAIRGALRRAGDRA